MSGKKPNWILVGAAIAVLALLAFVLRPEEKKEREIPREITEEFIREIAEDFTAPPDPDFKPDPDFLKRLSSPDEE